MRGYMKLSDLSGFHRSLYTPLPADPEWWNANKYGVDYEADGIAFHGVAKADHNGGVLVAQVAGVLEGGHPVIHTVEDVEVLQ